MFWWERFFFWNVSWTALVPGISSTFFLGVKSYHNKTEMEPSLSNSIWEVWCLLLNKCWLKNCIVQKPSKTVKKLYYIYYLLQHSTYVNSTLGVAAIKKNASLLTKTLAKETHRNRLTNDMNHWHSIHLLFWQQKMTSFLIDPSSKFLWNVCT